KENTSSSSSSSDEIQASHILVKHSRSRRPSSWKQEKITRSHEDALKQIKQFQDQIIDESTSKSGTKDRVSGQKIDQIKASEIFSQIASKESDCSSAKRGGDLGPFKKGMMQKSFEEAAFALEVGEISDIVNSD